MGYTLGEAAKATGKSKTTISRAIKGSKLSATKNAHGQYDIDPAELHRVYPAVKQGDGGATVAGATERNTELHHQISLLEARLEAEQQHSQTYKDMVEDLRTDRDKWRDEARATTRLLTDQSGKAAEMAPAGPETPPEARSLTWGERLTGKRKTS